MIQTYCRVWKIPSFNHESRPYYTYLKVMKSTLNLKNSFTITLQILITQ